jgi:hypothetical protein
VNRPSPSLNDEMCVSTAPTIRNKTAKATFIMTIIYYSMTKIIIRAFLKGSIIISEPEQTPLLQRPKPMANLFPSVAPA